MSIELQQHLSSLVDGELDHSEYDQVISNLKSDNEQQKTWERYCMISDAMKKNLPENPNHNLFSRIQTQLASEPALLVPTTESSEPKSTETESNNSAVIVELPQNKSKANPFKHAWGVGVAATVAISAIVGFQMLANSPVDTMMPTSMVNNNTNQQNDIQLVATPSPGTELNIVNNPTRKSTASDDTIFAEQSLMDDGAWTRITQIGNIPLGNSFLSNGSDAARAHVNVQLKHNGFPFTRSVSHENSPPTK